jgi:hypothetical protein
MPTNRPRHQVTETPAVSDALDAAARRWPDEPRSKLLLRLIAAGRGAVEQGHGEVAEARRQAVDATSGKYRDCFGEGYLAALRKDWPT